MSFEQLLQYLLSGITNGSIYAIVAIGFNIIYNTTGIINFAQGEFLMLGGMTAISLSAFMPLPLAILAAVVITSFVGALIMIREIALHVWDEKVRSLPYFTGNEITSINILGAYISPQVLWVLGISSIIVVCLGVFFKFTLTGRSMRACASNMTAARLCGINTKNMVTISFMLSAAIGALAGCVISPITQTQYDCGTSLAIKGFTVAILGGLGNSTGAVIGGIIIGLLEAFSISVLPLAYKDAIAIAILLIILFARPSGILGKKEEAALKEF
jgi:branched-chain amino acid transport system permease protein